MTTQLLVERIRRRISNGDPHDNDAVRNAEIKEMIGTVANRLLKAEFLNILNDGNTIPGGAMIATYRNISLVAGDGGRSYATLPITPMSLMDNMGVFSVYPAGYPELEFIPVPAGTVNIFKQDQMVSPLHAQLYTYDSGRVTIEADLIGAGITALDMKLCVMDISKHGDTDQLPITPEIEEQIMTEVVAFYNNKLIQNAAS